MYQVLIADDEPSVIASLEESIDWEGLGLKLAASVSNGNEVRKILERQEIDIAILDIRMPGMSGLELCEYIRRKKENIQIIIISGYAEFSYAERAIRYGVLGYCLKPLEYDRISRLLLKAVNVLESTHPAVSGADLLDALENGEEKTIADILAAMGFAEKEFYVAVSIGNGKLEMALPESLVIEFGRNQFGYLSGAPLSKEQIESFLRQPGNQGIGYLEKQITAGELAGALDECTVMAYQFFVDPDQRVCTRQDETGAGKILGEISRSMEKNRWDCVCDQLELAGEKYRQCFTVRTCIRLANMIYTGSLFREEETDYYIYSVKQLVGEYGSLTEMIGKLKRAIKMAAAGQESSDKYAENLSDGFSNTAFMRLVQYIGENYKKEISLTSAGEALHMNPNYVSQLFKKEAGITFVQYVTQLRMEEAVNRLTMTKDTAVDIAAEVGFNDYFYFLKTFKKFTGKTPSQYRKEN